MRYLFIILLIAFSVVAFAQSSIYNPHKPVNCTLKKTGSEQPLKGRVWVVDSEYDADLLVHVSTWPTDSAFAVKIFDHHRPNPDCGEWSIVNMYDQSGWPAHDFKICLTDKEYRADIIILLDKTRRENRLFMDKFKIHW